MELKEYLEKIESLQGPNAEQALPLCDEAIKAYPKEAKLYYLKALTLWNKSQVFDLEREEFSDLLKKATDLDPKFAEPHKLWAYANELLGYPELALRGYYRAVEADPTDVEAVGKKGEMLYQLHEYQEALETFNQALLLAKKPSDRLYNFLGYVKTELEDFQNAIADFTKSLEINPKSGGSLLGRGKCKKALGDNKGALEDFTQVINLYPEYPYGYAERGDVKILMNDNAAALEDYKKALEFDRNNIEYEDVIRYLEKKLGLI